MSEFIYRLHRDGVGVMPHIQSTGRVQGISFEINGAAFKGSSLGKAYSFNSAKNQWEQATKRKRLIDFDPLMDLLGSENMELTQLALIDQF